MTTSGNTPAAATETALQVINPLAVMDLNEARRRYQMMKQFVKEIMRKGVDYGVIPGTGEKPVLLKPGAEKLCSFFGFRAEFQCVESVQDWKGGFFSYLYKCKLSHAGVFMAEGDGCCNSMEKKYRWYTRYPEALTDDERGRVVKWETRKGKRGPYQVALLENDDPYSLVNTINKMAQKRALIAATLIAVNASDYFSYEHDDDVVDLEASPAGADQAGASDAQPAGQSAGGLVSIEVRGVEIQTGKNGNNTWTVHKVKGSDGFIYSTFDTKDAEAATRAKDAGLQVELEWKLDSKGYRSIVKGTVRPIEAGPQPDRVRIVCKSAPPQDWRKDLATAGFTCATDGVTWTAVESDKSAGMAEAASREPWFKEWFPIAEGGQA